MKPQAHELLKTMGARALQLASGVERPGPRHCSGCTLCCKLIPVEQLNKPAGQRCKHQRTGKGCAIYDHRPFSCMGWDCLWLQDAEGTATLSRPDRSHYVIDCAPDEIGIGGETLMVLQIWVDPLYPDAHKDPALRKLLDDNGIVALIRYGRADGFALFPPSFTGGGWEERGSKTNFTRESWVERMVRETVDEGASSASEETKVG